MPPVTITRPTSPLVSTPLALSFSIDSCNIISPNIVFCKLFFYPTSSLSLFLSALPSSSIHTYIGTCMHACIHTSVRACVHACIHTFAHTYIHSHIHTHLHTYIQTYTYIHTYILACCCNIYKASDCGAKTQLKQKQNFTDG